MSCSRLAALLKGTSGEELESSPAQTGLDITPHDNDASAKGQGSGVSVCTECYALRRTCHL